MPTDFRAIYDEHFDLVYVVLRRFGVKEMDLEDVAHEVFVSVHRRLAEYDSSRPMRAWLYGFAYRAASDYRKLARHRTTRRPVPVEEVQSDAELQDTQIDERRMKQNVVLALDSLDFEKRSLLVMHDLEGQSAVEIAEITQVPLNTVYSRLRSARAELKLSVLTIEKQKGRAL